MLDAIPIHGLEAVLVAAELALSLVEAVLTLTEEPLANVERYDELRKETCHER